MRVYDAASGKLFTGTLDICGTGISDFTTGANAPAPGQLIHFVGARLMNQYLGAFVRAVPNRAYTVHLVAPEVGDGMIVRWGKAPRIAWENEPYVLPFIPTKIVALTDDASEPYYGYTDLAPLPGYASSMSPLTRESVVYAIHGFGFGNEDALQAFLQEDLHDVRYIEVLYIDRSAPRIMKRAFVPLLRRAQAGSAWAIMARRYPIFEPSQSMRVAPYLILGGLIAAVVAFQNSSAGDSYARARQKCLAQGLPWQLC